MCDNHIGLLLCFLQGVSLKFKLTLFGAAQFALKFECGTWKQIYILMLWRSGMQDVNGKNCSRSNVWDCFNQGCSFRLRTNSNRDWESRNLCGAVRTAPILTANVLMRKVKVNTKPSSNVCSLSSNVSSLLHKEFCTISLRFKPEWKVCGWRFADAGVPQRSNNWPLGYPRTQRPLSVVVVTGSESLCCASVRAQWDAICTVISWASRCCWWSWRRDKGRKVTGATVGFAASLSGRRTELWSTHWHLHHVCMF